MFLRAKTQQALAWIRTDTNDPYGAAIGPEKADGLND